MHKTNSRRAYVSADMFYSLAKLGQMFLFKSNAGSVCSNQFTTENWMHKENLLKWIWFKPLLHNQIVFDNFHLTKIICSCKSCLITKFQVTRRKDIAYTSKPFVKWNLSKKVWSCKRGLTNSFSFSFKLYNHRWQKDRLMSSLAMYMIFVCLKTLVNLSLMKHYVKYNIVIHMPR